MSKAFYITTPIYYVNDKPHIGHAYTTIACDVLARFKRLDGYDVKFLTGTDEHGQKVAKAAADKGITPQALCDANSRNFQDLAKTLGISNTDFIRTTEERHIKSCQALWKRLEANGQIYLDKYAGWYAVRDEAFYDESELTTGPTGEKLAPSGAPVEWVEEESYFFPLSKWQQKLLDFYDANPDFMGPKSRFNEIYSFVKGGLNDLSISRTAFSWGVPVPDNDKHVMYVWIDALTNYITSLGYPDETGEMAKFWPAENPVALHMVGKDIIRFHCVYWPAFLMAAKLPVPRRVFAHGWWTVEGQKMSKSLGNAIDPNMLVEKYGLDQLRFFMMREIPFGNDGDFSEAAIAGRINGELANAFGNLAQRFLSFIAKNLGGVLPAPHHLTPEDDQLLAACSDLLDQCREAMERQAFNDVIEAIWVVVRAANAYVDVQAPWALKKTDPVRMNTVLYVLAETVRHLAILIQPFVPTSAAKMLDQLAVPETSRTFEYLCKSHALKAGTQLPTPTGVFPRYGD
ncbi:MAG: methionine--tRNA ligase, partial [Rhodospirillaceae bacterium]|nr:methionine--tRNA ligase [Rhodospirillaceae bacterium]